MAVFTYTGGVVSMATGSYGGISVRKGSQVTASNSITNSARSFIEGTPTTTLFEPIDRTQQFTRIAHGSGYNSTRFNFNTTEPYNSGAYSTSEYISASNIVFDGQVSTGITSSSSYNTQTNSGEYWSHAYGYVNSEFGTALTVDNDRNVWVVGSTDYCSCTVASTTASLTSTASFTNSTTTMTSGTNDSGYWFLSTPPWNHNIFGQDSQYFVVHTNSWISFNAVVNTTQTTFSGTSPAVANIQIGAGEASCQRIYWGTFGTAPNRTYRIRFEGTNATTGTLGSPNMVWEAIFYESNKNIFDIQIGAWTPPTTNANGISDGTTYFGTFTPTANTGWRFTTGNATAGAYGNNITLVKYSPKGIYQKDNEFNPYTGSDALAVMSIGREGSDVGEAIKIGSDGRIYILYTSNSLGYVSGVVNNELGVIKIDPEYLYSANGASLSTVWNKTFGTTAAESGQSFDIDSNDNLYITGFTGGSGQGGNDVIAIKVDKTGKVIWKKTYGASTGGDLGNAIRISPDGNSLYIWGYSGSTPLVGTSTDWFLLKINSSTGSIIWQKHFNIGATTQGQAFENSVDVDEFGNVYVCGFAATSPQAYFVAKLDSNGNFIWHRSVGALTGNPDAGTSIRYKNGHLYVGGQDTSTIPNPPNESYGLGVTKINSLTGQVVSNYVIGGTAVDYALGIEVDNYGDVYATGTTNSSVTGLASAVGQNTFTAKFILDTPQGGFTLSGSAAVWNNRKNVFRYSSGKEYFSAQSIVFQNHPINDLFATGAQAVFYANEATYKLEKEFVFAGSGSIALSTLTTISVQTRSNTYNTDLYLLTRSQILYNFSNQLLLNNSQLVTIAASNAVSTDSASAKVTWNPAEDTHLFAISGSVSTKLSRAFLSSNNFINTSGTASQKISKKLSGVVPSEYYNPYQIIFGNDENITSVTSGTSLYNFKKEIRFTATGSIALTNGYSNLQFVEQADETTQLFSVSGQHGTRVFVPNWIASGSTTISNVVSPSKVSTRYTTNYPYYNSYQIVFEDGVNYKTSEFSYTFGATITLESKFTFAGTGSITTSNGYSNLKFIEQADETTQLFGVTGQHGTRVFVPNYISSGSVVVGSAVTAKYIPSITGIPPAEQFAPGQIVFGNEENIRTVSDGTANYRFQKGAFGGTGQITQDSSAGKSFAKVSVVLSAPILFYYTTNIITKLAMRYAGKNPTTPFGGLDIVFEELEPNAPPREFSLSGGSTIPNSLFKLSGSGQTTIGGTVYFTNTKDFDITGNLTAGLESQSEVTFKPAITAPSLQLFSITGQHGTRVFVPNWRALGNINIAGDVSNIKFTSDWVGSSPIQYYDPYQVVFGEGENYYATEYRLDRTAAYRTENKLSGSGQLFAASGVSQAALFRPPTTAAETQLFTISGGYTNLKFIEQADESTILFTISGGASPPASKYPWSGSSPIQYYDPYQVVFGEGENYYATEYRLSSTAAYKTQSKLSGSGQLFAASGVSQSALFRPPTTAAGIQLFTISGGYTDLKFIEQADETTQLFTLDGSYSNLKFVSSNVATGNISVSGTLVEKQTEVSPQGSGSLSVLSGAAQTFGANPPEDVHLFSITGQHGTRVFVPNWIANGTTTVSNSSTHKFSTQWFGSSPVGYFNSYQIVFEDGENFGATEFKYYQYSVTNYEFKAPPLQGSGTLFLTSGAAQVASFTANPPEDTQLFTIFGGYTDLKFIEQADEQTTLFTIEGSAYKIIANEINGVNLIKSYYGLHPSAYYDSYQIVFGNEENVVGEYVNTSTAKYNSRISYVGSGFSAVSGQGIEVYKNGPWQGTGSIFVSGGYSDLKFIEQADESTQLFTTNGTYSNLQFTSRNLVSGSTSVTGTLVEKHIDSVSGSGSIATLSGAAEKVTFNPLEDTHLFTISGGYTDLKFIEQADESTQLFQLSGSATNIKFGTVYLGSSPIEYFSPYEVVFGEGDNFAATEYKYYSTSNYKFTPAPLQGSGTIFTVSGAAQAFGANPPEDTQLFTISGQHGTRVFVPSWTGSGTTSISGTASESRTRGNFTGNSPSEYYSAYQIVFGEDENYGASDLTSTNYSRFRFSPATQVGTGTLFSGGLYSNLYAVFKPVDATDSEQLFSINGTHGTRVFVPNWRATGTIASLSGAAEKVTFNPPEDTQLFSISGTVVEKHIDIVSGSGSIAPDGFFSNLKASYRPFDATDSDPLFSISGAAGVKLRDYIWVSAVVEYDPYEYIINDEWIIPDFIKIKDNTIWDNTNNIYRSATAQSLTKDYDASGSITIEGTLGTRVFVPNWIAAGTISITGTVVEKQVEVALAGSGSISTLSGAAQTFGANPPEDTFLFSVSNTATESQTDTISGSGTISASGTLVEKRTKVAPAGSGTINILPGGTATVQLFNYVPEGGLLFILSGSSETVTYNPPEDTYLFSVSNTATESHTDIALPGFGSIATLSGGAEKVTFNPPEDTQLFSVAGAYTDFKFTIDESGSGTTSVTGTAVEKHIDATSGSGTISLTNTATESQTEIAVPGSGTFVFDGASDDLYIKGPEEFGGTLFVIGGGAERVVFNPPEGNQLFDVSGAYSEIKATKDYDASGSITIEGTLGTRVFVPNWISTGGFVSLSGAAQKVTFNPPEDTQLFDIAGAYSNFKFTTDESGSGSFSVLSGAAEALGANPPESLILFAIGGAATESQSDTISGSGSIGTLSGASQSVTFNPPEDTQLFSVSGTATEREINKESGSGSITSDGFYSNLKVTFNPPEDTQLFIVSGAGTESQTDAMSGSGSIAALSGGAEKVTFNPPEDTQLFSVSGTATVKQLYGSLVGSGTSTITGTATESQTDAMSGSGSIAALSGGAEKVTFNPPEDTQLFAISGTVTQKHVDSVSGSGQVSITGTATEKHVDKVSGSGTFSVLSGAAESFGANPPESLILFAFAGAATESQTDITSGSGSITSNGFYSNLKVTFNPPEDTQLFDITGAYSNFKFTTDESGSGTVIFSGTATESQTDITSGSGSIGTLSGAAEKVTFNPPEDTQLFSVTGAYSNFIAVKSYVGSGEFTITGTAVEKNTESYVASGTVDITGSTTWAQRYIAPPGFGSIATLSGGAEKVTFNPPEDTQLFSVSGAYSNFKASKSYVGSGNIFGISGAAQSVTFNPLEDTQLFVVSGTATESQTDITSGSGSIATLSGVAESVTFNPPEDTQLFDISGAYSEFKFISSEIVSGNISISGNVIEKHVDIASGFGQVFITGTAVESQTNIALSGSGSLFTASGSAEAFGVNPPEDIALFVVEGAYSDFKAIKRYEGSGEFSTLSGAVVVAAITEIGVGLFDVSNTANESVTYKSIDGSGTLFTLSEASESTTVNPPEDTQLFSISGDATTRTNFLYYGGNLVLFGQGNSVFSRALVPQQGSGEIFVDGDSVDKWEKLFRAQGSGALYGFSGAAESTTNIPPQDTYIDGDGELPDRQILFFVYGSASEIKRAFASDTTVVINTSGTATIGTALPERVFATII